MQDYCIECGVTVNELRHNPNAPTVLMIGGVCWRCFERQRKVQQIIPQLGKKGNKVRFKWTCCHCRTMLHWKWDVWEWCEGPIDLQCNECGLMTPCDCMSVEEE